MKKIFMGTFIFLSSLFHLYSSEPLPVLFMRSVMQERPVLYEEEVKLFPELNLHSYVILLKFGYVDTAGKWKKNPPKYSPLMELIRMNRKSLWGNGIKEIIFFNGEVRWYREGKSGKLLFSTLACIVLKYFHGNDKTIVISVHKTKTNNKIDFPITVNGKELSAMLGFVYKNGVPELEKTTLEKLKKHMKMLNVSAETP